MPSDGLTEAKNVIWDDQRLLAILESWSEQSHQGQRLSSPVVEPVKVRLEEGGRAWIHLSRLPLRDKRNGSAMSGGSRNEGP
jgi:hypothetical protein